MKPALFQTIAISPDDFAYIRSKLLELSGIHLSDRKLDLLQTRLRRRLEALDLPGFREYREYLAGLSPDHGEWQLMVNELTTNKTDFFREPAHFDYVIQNFIPEWENRVERGQRLSIWSAACSTGEEPYSIAMAFDQYFKGQDRFRIVASDLDTSALAYAANGVYPKQRLADIPSEFHALAIAYGQGKLSEWGRIKDSIHKRVEFLQCNLTMPPYAARGPFDVIFCRNVFIYFQPHTIEKIICSLYEQAAENSLLLIGHSETLQNLKNPWEYVAPSIFRKKKSDAPRARGRFSHPKPSKRKRVLVVDDSKTITQLLAKILSQDPELEVVGEINYPDEIEAALKKLKPDVMTLDIHMPVMDGCAVLEKLLPQYPVPTVLISSISMEEGPYVLRALELGAVDYIQKPSFSEISTAAPLIVEKIKNAINAKVQRRQSEKISRCHARKGIDAAATSSTLIAIGSSTGGTEALRILLTQMPSNIPPILIVQHIPPVFSKALADRLNQLCPFEVKEAEDGDRVQAGRVLIAPGGRHMLVQSCSGGLEVKLTDAPAVNRHCPSVDVLFDSVANLIGAKSMGVILTGMGGDGSKGLLKMRQAGAFTIAQDEESCVVFGMPKEAIRLGAAQEVCSLNEIPELLMNNLERKH